VRVVLATARPQALGDLAQLDYPYATHFLFDLPPNPTAVACQDFGQAGGGVAGLGAAVAVLSRPGAACVDTDLSEWWQFAPGFIRGAWTFQRCTEIVMPVEVSDANPMFLPCSTYGTPCPVPCIGVARVPTLHHPIQR
jgi:hypothetical protein